MSAYTHRKTGGISDELTPAERLELSQRRLASEVGRACQRWLEARGLASKGFNRDHPADRSQPILSATSHQPAPPGGESKATAQSFPHRSPRIFYAWTELGFLAEQLNPNPFKPNEVKTSRTITNTHPTNKLTDEQNE